MKKTLLLICCLLAATILCAQTSTPLPDAQRQEVIRKVTLATTRINAMQCQFTQRKQTSMLADPVLSQGSMAYTRPDRLRWQYTSPQPFTLIVNGDSLTLLDPSGNPIKNTNANRTMRGLSSMILGSINGQKLFDDRLFTTQLFDDGKHYRAEMTPRRKEMQRMFQSITFLFDKTTLTISTVILSERKGDTTTIQFHHITIQ